MTSVNNAPRRPLFQFSLAVLFSAMTLIAVGAWCFVLMNRAEDKPSQQAMMWAGLILVMAGLSLPLQKWRGRNPESAMGQQSANRRKRRWQEIVIPALSLVHLFGWYLILGPGMEPRHVIHPNYVVAGSIICFTSLLLLVWAGFSRRH